MIRSRSHGTDFLFTLALFSVFTASALLVTLLGANVYRRTIQGMDQNDNSRISLTYVAEKIRQHDTKDSVQVQTLEGRPALVLGQTTQSGKRYETWIFIDDGYLKEILVPQGTVPKASEGQSIKQQADFSVSKEGRLLTLTMTGADGQKEQMQLYLRCDAS